VPISGERAVAGGVYVVNGQLVDDRAGTAEVVADLRGVATLRGRHNAQNAAAAYATARATGLDAHTAAGAIASFPGLAHRQEIAGTRAGVTFVNDSKATNDEAALRALAAFDEIYWIAGGQPKDDGLAATRPGWGNVRRAFLIGEAAETFRTTLADHLPAEICGDLDTAVAAAFKRAREEGARAPVVLLSPACASFDQYADFAARGDAFKRAVAALAGETDRDLGAGGAA